MDLTQLQQLITEGAASKTANSVLSDRMAEATALRDASLDSERQTGYVDPLSAIAGVIKNSRGRQGLRENRPQAEQALRSINELGAAKENYGLGLDAAKVLRDQGNADRTYNAGRTDAANAQTNTLAQQAGLAKYRQNLQQNVESKAAVDFDKETSRQRELVDALEVEANAGEPVYLQNANDPRQERRGKKMPNGDVYIGGEKAGPEWTVLTTKTGKGRGRGGSGKGDVDPMATVADPDAMGRILVNPELGSTTGMLDPTRYLADAGFAPWSDDPEAVSKRQSLALDMKGAALNSVKKNLEGLGVNPTDKDLEIAFGDIPSQDAEPLAWGTWAKNKYRPRLVAAFNTAIVDGTTTKEDRDAYLVALDKDIEQNRQMWEGADGDTPNKIEEKVPATSNKEALLKRKAELEAQLNGGG